MRNVHADFVLPEMSTVRTDALRLPESQGAEVNVLPFAKPTKRARVVSGPGLAFPKHPRIVDSATLKRYHHEHPQCEVCQEPAMPTPHHLRPVSLGGDDVERNLISLCVNHHTGREGIHPLGPFRWCERCLHRLSKAAQSKVKAAYGIPE